MAAHRIRGFHTQSELLRPTRHPHERSRLTYTPSVHYPGATPDADNNPLFRGSLLWGTSEGIGTVGAGQNPEPETEPFFPPPGGIRFVFFTFLPKTEGTGDIDRYRVDDPTVPSDMPGLAESFSEERPGMHITDTIDFVHVLSGEMVLELDQREVLVRKGDTIIMRGAWHNWRNEGTEPCTVASVLVGTHRSESATPSRSQEIGTTAAS